MKKLIHVLMTLMLIASFTCDVVADNSYNACAYQVSLYKVSAKMPHREINDEEGKRKPSRPIVCNISQDYGVEIAGIDDMIVSYEIWNITGMICLCETTEESVFLNELFLQTGECLIQFNAADYSYIGYVDCEI